MTKKVVVEITIPLDLLLGWSGDAWKDGQYIDDIQEFFDEEIEKNEKEQPGGKS